jgi:hypothetical protein
MSVRLLVERLGGQVDAARPGHGAGLGVHGDMVEEGGVAKRPGTVIGKIVELRVR